MTEIAFHFNAPDKLAYACRLLRKAVQAGARAVVTAEAEQLQRLNTQLWTFSQLDFLAHAMDGDPPQVVQASPVLLTTQPDAAAGYVVLVNLSADVPAGFSSYPRLIEVVTQDEQDRQHARTRWKRYAGLGYELQRHDLNLRTDP